VLASARDTAAAAPPSQRILMAKSTGIFGIHEAISTEIQLVSLELWLDKQVAGDRCSPGKCSDLGSGSSKRA
jgi:hypothetical protein